MIVHESYKFNCGDHVICCGDERHVARITEVIRVAKVAHIVFIETGMMQMHVPFSDLIHANEESYR